MIERMATPNTIINDPAIRSILLLGWKSPNPTVERVVKAKYTIINVYFLNEWSSTPK